MPSGAVGPYCGSQFCTWWHAAGVVNTQTPVDPASVRQSRRYFVQVRSEGTNWSDSFVYESIPRNGKGRVFSPWDPPGSDTLPEDVDDGVSQFEYTHNISMAWSHFLLSEPVDIKILSRDSSLSTNVVIRPTALRYQVNASEDGGIIVHVPFDPLGRKFSVEWPDDLLEYRSDGKDYVEAPAGAVVGIEPARALLLFASPFPSVDSVPEMTADNTRTMAPGPINNGDWGNSPILYFPPGVYWMNQAESSGLSPKLGESHIRLGANTSWVHLAPGAFVKAALEYTTAAPVFHLTGAGTARSWPSRSRFPCQAQTQRQPKYSATPQPLSHLRRTLG